MSSFALRRIRLPALFGIAFAASALGAGQAQESRTFVVPLMTGYGVEECLDTGSECGATVADAWCRAYGEGVAVEFGRYEVDKSGASSAPWPAPRRYYVNCSVTEFH